MFKYLLHRLMMMIPTLLGITLMSFAIINMAPGSPIEQRLQALRMGDTPDTGRGGEARAGMVTEELVEALKVQYGFDKPLHVRYWLWLKNVCTLNFGESFKYEEPVTTMIARTLPVSLQFGISSILLVYFICVPLGILKAVRNNSFFDTASSFVLFIAYSIPPLMLGILLMVYFAGGSYWSWFPSGGLMSDNYTDLTTWGKIVDRIHHFVLPLICYMINSFTVLTMMMKNSLLDEIKLDYVRTARAKGLSEKVVIFKHALKNALIPLVTGIGSFLGVFLAGSLIIENIFSLNGIGRLGYTAAMNRDYNVLMGLIFISSVVSLLGRLISDMLYVVVDPRIDFQG